MYILVVFIAAVYTYFWRAGTTHVQAWGHTVLATPSPATASSSPRRGKVPPAGRAATSPCPSITLWMWPLGPCHTAEGGRERWGTTACFAHWLNRTAQAVYTSWLLPTLC